MLIPPSWPPPPGWLESVRVYLADQPIELDGLDDEAAVAVLVDAGVHPDDARRVVALDPRPEWIRIEA